MTQSGHFGHNRGFRRSDSRNSDMGGMGSSAYAGRPPTIRIGQLILSFFGQLRWLIPLFLIGMAVAFFMTKDFKRTYEGDARVLVQLGSEYIYESVTSQQAPGLTQTPDHIVLNEIGLMKNSELIERVTGELTTQFGETRFAKAEYAKINAAIQSGDQVAVNNAIVDLHKKVDKSFSVEPKAKSSVVDMVFKHEDPEIAVAGIQTFMRAYLDYRKAIFLEGSGDVISERLAATEDQLADTEAAIQRFLRKNGISDFTSEQDGVRKRTEALRATLNKLRGDMSETETALATVEAQLRNTPPTINLYVDDRASQRVAQAELELKQLLAKYLPNSRPVIQKQEELRRLKEIPSANGGQAAGARRVGPNTVYQALMTRRNTLQSTADSYREKEITLQRQLDSADAKVRRMNQIAPTYTGLLRERSTLDTRLKGYNAKEQEALVNQQQAQAESENIRVISISNLPRKGRNMRMIMFVLATMAWGFTLFMLALLRVFLDPRLYGSVALDVEDHSITPTRIPSSAYAADEPEPVYEPLAKPYIPDDAASYTIPARYQPPAYDPPAYEPPAYDPPAYHPAAASHQPPAYQPAAAAAYQDPTNPYLSGHGASGSQAQPQNPYQTIPRSAA